MKKRMRKTEIEDSFFYHTCRARGVKAGRARGPCFPPLPSLPPGTRFAILKKEKGIISERKDFSISSTFS